MSFRRANTVVSLVVLLTLLIQPLAVGAAAPTPQSGSSLAPTPATAQPGQGFLFRASVTLAGSRNLARLEKVGVLVLSTSDDNGKLTALVLADGEQLADLARLGFRPQAADELRLLVSAQGPEKAWLVESLQPLLAQADAVVALQAVAGVAGVTAAPDAAAEAVALQALRSSLRALTPEQLAGVASSSSVDDDADGLTNTQEAWWCTDPMDTDTDDDGRTDGAEIQVLKDWMANERAGAPNETPWPSWPFNTTTCPDKDHDSIPNLAERWELGLNMDLESSDRDKFDDGQELFGVTYCPGGDLSCGYGDLPRSSDSGYVGAAMPSWLKAPGKHPLVAAFPMPEVDVVESSLHVETVTTVTTDHTIASGTEKSYSTAKTDGTSSGVADTEMWNEWQETSKTAYQYAAQSRMSAPGFQGATADDDPWGKVWETGYDFTFDICDVFLNACSTVGSGLKFLNALGTAISSSAPRSCTSSGTQPPSADQYGSALGQNMCLAQPIPVPAPTPVPCDDLPSPPPVFTEGPTCKAVPSGYSMATGDDGAPLERYGTGTQDRVQSMSGHDITYSRTSGNPVTVSSSPVFQVSYPKLQSSSTSTRGSSHGTARTVSHTAYEEQTITNGEAFSSEESWGSATAVDSAHSADLWFTYNVRNSGTEYAREIKHLAFNIYIGDNPNPACTYHVGSTACGVPVDTVLFANFMPGEEHPYTSFRIPLTLEQMEAVDLGGPIRVVVEDFTYGADELFYQDAANAGVLIAMEDGTDDGEETIDTYLVPTWGTETVLDVLARYFPHTTDADGMLTAIWTAENRSDTPVWCTEPNHIGGTLWCKHVLSTADWWNVYTDGMGDGSEGFQDTPASPGQVALFRFNKDTDLDGYSDRSEERLGTDPTDPNSFPKPELIAGLHSTPNGNQVVSTLSLLNTGLYDAYGVEAVMIAPDDSISITNNTVGGSGRVRAQRQVIVGSRIVLQDPLPSAWIQTGHARPTVGGYYTGPVDRTYGFSVTCSLPAGCDVSSGAWSLNWADGLGASGSLNFGAGYSSPTLLAVGAFGLQISLLSGKVYGGDAFSVDALTPRDTFRYTIAAGHESDYTSPVVIVSYNDPQGNHRFVTPINLTSPTNDLSVHSGKMLHAGADVEIVTSEAFDSDASNTTNLVLQVPATRMVDAHAFLEFIDPDGNVVREEALTQTLDTGPNIVPITWNPADFNPPYDPAKDYIVMAFFTDWQGNILSTAARPLSSFQVDPTAAFAMDGAGATWNFGSVAQGTILEHAFAFGNTGLRGLKAAVVGTGARADQSIPGQPAWLDTGIDVTVGDAIGVRAGGTVCYGTGGTICYGPVGSGSAASSAFTLPGVSSYSLIGRIGTGAAFLVGSTYVSTAATAGRLYLGTNDETTQYSNNTGTYQAHIEIQGLPNSRGTEPNFGVGPTDTGFVTITLDTYYLPVGAFDRTLQIRTSDPAQPVQTLRVQGMVETYVVPAQATATSLFRPWDLYVAVAGNGAKRSVIAFDDTIAADAASVQPLRVYDDTRQTQLGSGRSNARADATLGLLTTNTISSTAIDVTSSPTTEPQLITEAIDLDAGPAAITATGDMFGDGRDGVMPTSGNLDNNNGFGIGTVNGSAGSTSISVTDHYAVWRINPGDRVLIHQTRGTGAGSWELNKAVNDFTGSGTFTLASPLKYTYSTSGDINRAQILRVPQYSTCNVTGTVNPLTAWNGTWGGILAVMCNGTMSITGALNVSGYGFTGGTHVDRPNRYGRQGESFSGLGSYTYLANEGGGGAGYGSTSANSRGGGGGGYGTAGQVGGGGDADDRYAGRGGNAYGDSGLTSTHLGSGGGAGGDLNSQAIGGAGAGFSFISAREINVSGSITANGQNGVDGSPSSQSAGGGGGAGGAILLRANSIVVGTGKVMATGGVGGNGSIGVIGGAGGLGRIRIEYCNSISGTTNPPANQANINCYSIIKGRVFSDTNGNGVQDSSESGLASVTVTVGSAGTVITNSAGDYTKTVSAPGSYTVSVAPPSGYHCITPCSVVASVNPDETKTVNFALQPRVSIAGKVFHDNNNDGVQSSGEVGVAGVTIQLSTSATRTTASDGSYSFVSLQPGSYSTTVTVPDGYVSTTNTNVTCNLTAGQTCTANFGILQYTIEKLVGSPHQNRLFLPENFTGGRRYWAQYGRSLTYSAGGSLTAQVEAPQAHYGSAELDVFVTSPASSNIFLQIGLDVGCDSSQEWSVNGNYAVPVTFAATGLAVGFNRYLATLPPDPDGSVAIPLCTSFNLAGQLYLTDLVLTPDGISDVSIAASDIALNPTNPVEGDEVTVQAVVHNASQFASGALTASFYATSADWGDWYIGSAFVPNVPTGGTAQASILWNTLGFTGDTPVRVSIDPYNRIAETNEANNEATASLTIKTRPDLRVTTIALSDTEPVVGQVVTVTLTLHNNGQTGAGPFTVDLYDGNPASGGTLVQALDVAALAGGAASNLLIPWTPAAACEHHLFVEVDPGRTVSEYAEDNNETWHDVYVGLAGPILIDSGGGDAYDPAYTAENGFGYLDGETSTFCGDDPDKTQRSDYDAEVQYRFDHLLPGHFYHLDVTLFECDGTGRQEKISVDDNVIDPLIDLADGAVHRLSYLLDPAFYADRSVLISIAEIYGNDVVVSEVNLYDVDYRYSDAGGGNDPAYSLANGYGWLDGVAQTSWGTLPYQSRRTDIPDSNPDDDPDNELRYRYDRLDPVRRYQLHATVYQGAGTGTVIESIAVDDVDTGTTITVVGVQRRDVTLAIPPGTYASDRSIVVRIIRTNAAANAFVNLIALEELTLSQGSDEFQNLTLHGTSPNWISFNIKPPVRPALYCSGVTATSAFTILAGDALLAGAAAPVNSLVEAYTPAGVKVGCHKVTTAGQYGYMRVYGAEGATPGMAPGEPVQLKINGIASQPAPYPVIWQNDKLTRDVDLAAADVIPVETFLDPIAGQVVKLQSETGTYLPPPADPRFNTTTTVAAGWGYLLYTNAAATVAVTGERVPADTPLTLHAGWNWLGYLPTCELPVATALAGIAGRYDLLHNEVGTYRPPPANPAYNTFNTMTPGKGYMIHMTAAATQAYPATGCGAAAGTEPVAEPIGAMPACPAVATGVFTHYYGAAMTSDRPMPAGAVILAYSPRGEVVGCGQIEKGGLYPYLRVYGAEDAQPGMQPGEAVHFTVDGRLTQPSAAASWQNDWDVYPLDLEIGGSDYYLPLIVR